ncbi:stealth conserved region 3 domain-containing protein [Brachybacterium sp.]|uniref:stealth family protein n=1 Tax=Brachybacterium sp. TaxID=1891286 RepID=UPI003F8E33F7
MVLLSAAPGNVWTGLRLRPQQARDLENVDLHDEREQSLAAVLDVAVGVPCVLAPPSPRRPWHLAIRAEDLPVLRRQLQGLPAHWALHMNAGQGALIVRPHLAVASRPLNPIPDLDVVIDVLHRDDHGNYRGTAQGAPARISAADWEHYARESVSAQCRVLAVPAPTMPIDMVVTWVDGGDPRWRHRRDESLQTTVTGVPAQRTSLHASATDASRYLDSGELRYALRSVHRFANWVRRIYLVTDAQVPEWLRTDHPRIHVVDHRKLLGGSRFNSHAIESALHRIPGLAEHYLYLNDDVFFGRIAYPGDFFAAEGLARFFPSDLPIDPGPATSGDLPIMAAAKNGRDLLAARFGIEVRTKIRHTVHPQLKSVNEQIEAENPEAIARTRASLFRSPADLSIASALHHWYAYALGRAVPSEPNYLYVDLASANLGQTLDALESLRHYNTFCLNQEEGVPPPGARRELAAFLDRYLPTPAPWERADSSH